MDLLFIALYLWLLSTHLLDLTQPVIKLINVLITNSEMWIIVRFFYVSLSPYLLISESKWG